MNAKTKFSDKIITVRPVFAEYTDEPDNIERFYEIDDLILKSSYLSYRLEELHKKLLNSSGLHSNSDMIAMFIAGFYEAEAFFKSKSENNESNI